MKPRLVLIFDNDQLVASSVIKPIQEQIEEVKKQYSNHLILMYDVRSRKNTKAFVKQMDILPKPKIEPLLKNDDSLQSIFYNNCIKKNLYKIYGGEIKLDLPKIAKIVELSIPTLTRFLDGNVTPKTKKALKINNLL